MATIGSLWLAIVLAAVLCWIASAIIWTALPHHKKEYRGLSNEEAARAALGPDLTPGLYHIPHYETSAEMKSPEFVEKLKQGPVAMLTVLPRGGPGMGKSMVLMFIYFLAVSGCVAYLATRTLPIGTDYMSVFRVTGTVAWLAYGFAVIPEAIWFGRPWSSVWKHLADSLVYGLLTAGAFGWQWP